MDCEGIGMIVFTHGHVDRVVVFRTQSIQVKTSNGNFLINNNDL